MIDKEKVLKGLECCACWKCPYRHECNDVNMKNAFTGWKTISGYDCYLENGYIIRLLDENHELRFLWKPSGNGLDAIPRCSISRFRNGLKTGTVVIR